MLFLTGGETSVGPYMCPESPLTWTSTLLGILPDRLFHSLSVVFDRWWVVTQTSTLVGMSTWPASSFCPCCFWQVVGCLWSLHVSQIPRHTDFHPGRNGYQPAGSLCLCWFLSRHMDVCGSFCLCCFWLAVGGLWSLHLFQIPCHTDLCPGMSVYLTSWLIQSVLFLTGSETSHGPPPWKECLPDQLVHCVCVDFWQVVRSLWSLHVSRIPRHMDLHPIRNPTWPAVSFSLCCFWQVVSRHTDLHSGRNVYLTS